MIQNRLENNGNISDEYQLEFIKQRNATAVENEAIKILDLFEQVN